MPESDNSTPPKRKTFKEIWKESQPPSFWETYKKTLQEELAKSGTQVSPEERERRIKESIKSGQNVGGVIALVLLVVGFTYCFVTMRHSNEQDRVRFAATAQANATWNESYEQGMLAGREQLHKNYSLGGGLPLPNGQEIFARQAADRINPDNKDAFIKGYIFAMKKIWENTTGWKEYNYRNITPGEIKPGTLLYEYGMTEPTCSVVQADSQRMLVRFFKNGSVEWKSVPATASEFYEAR
jgi:hypothetical protein